MQCILLAADDQRIEPFLCETDAAINQYPAWATVQQTLGVESLRLGVENDVRELVGYTQIFIRRLPLSFTWWSVPRGPVILGERNTEHGAQIEKLLISEIAARAKTASTVYVRFDWPERMSDQFPVSSFQFIEAGETNFPSTTLMVDVQKSEEELLAEMHQKGRYNIRVAEKHGVTVREVTDDLAAETFFTLLTKTTARDGFAGHDRAYYAQFLKALVPAGLATTFIAEKEGTPCAAIIVTFAGQTATYYYGASDHAERQAMAPYAVQWAAIRAAKARGCARYDFLGIAPEQAVNHPLAGVTDFKRKFGGRVVTYPPSSDLILRPTAYRLVTLARKLRRG